MGYDDPIYLIEGMALSGQALGHRLRPCDNDDESEVVVIGVDGKEVSTGCLKKDIARRLENLLSFYERLATLILIGGTGGKPRRGEGEDARA